MSNSTLEYSSDQIEARDRRRVVLGRGFWTLVDQGVVSAGNFFTTVLPARGESRGEYGAFAILFGVLLVLNNVHMSLVTYQVSVRGGASDDPKSLRRYVGNGILASFLLALPCAGAIAVACYWLKRPELIGWMSLASLTWQLQETTRRGLMAQMRFNSVVAGDAISFLGKAAVLFALSWLGKLQIANILIAMSVTSLLGFALQLWQLGFVPLTGALLGSFIRTSWELGRWLLLNNLLFIVNVQGVAWLTAGSHGVEETAQLQAVSNVLGLTHPVLMGISGIIVPATARARASAGLRAALRAGASYAGIGAALLTPLYLVIAVVPSLVLWLFYGDKYVDSTLLLRLMVLIYAIDFFGWMLSALLNGLEENRAVFLSSLAMASVTLAVTVPLTLKMGVEGALIGSCFSVLARVMVGAQFVARLHRQAKVSTSHPISA